MAALTYDPDHTARGVARLIDRYAKPRTSALLASWLDELQQAEDALWQLLVERSLASAEGDQLDVLGEIVGQPRQGRSDEVYRLWISARNLVNRSSGTTTQMLTIVRKLIAETDTVTLEEYYPAAMVFRLDGAFTLDGGYQIAYMLRLAKAAGVLFQMTWPTEGDIFTFAPADTPVLSSDLGFDEGHFAVVADGSFIPPEEPPLPLGTLVIDDVPITIDGDYLVITPPVTVRTWQPVRPLVAKGVRPAAAAAPAAARALRAPRSGGTIELEDAFADASLEMVLDQFRVAAALQAAIVAAADAADDATAAIAAHAASTSNPHGVTKTQVGLSAVSNDAQLKRAAADFATFTAKTTPVAADLFLIEDSAAAGAKAKVALSDLATALAASVPGTILQTVRTESATFATINAQIPNDGTIPQITEGGAYPSLDTVITPKSATSKLRVEVMMQGVSANSISGVTGGLFRDSTANAIASGYLSVESANRIRPMVMQATVTSGSLSATTFRVRFGDTAGTVPITINGTGSGFMGGVYFSSMTITEIAT